MTEKIYKVMGSSGVTALTAGIVTGVIGVVCSILLIVSGARLLKSRKDLTF